MQFLLKGWIYDAFMAPGERFGFGRRRRRLLHGLAGPVLEIGVGTGLNLAQYADDPAVIAIDPQLSLLRRAERRRRSAQHLVCARAEALPFRDSAFCAAVGTLVFCSVGDPLRGLAEARRVLVADGELRLIEHVRWERHPVLARLQDWLTPAWKVVADGCHLNRATAALVRRAGFRVELSRSYLGGLLLEIHSRPGVGSEGAGPTGPLS